MNISLFVLVIWMSIAGFIGFILGFVYMEERSYAEDFIRFFMRARKERKRKRMLRKATAPWVSDLFSMFDRYDRKMEVEG